MHFLNHLKGFLGIFVLTLCLSELKSYLKVVKKYFCFPVDELVRNVKTESTENLPVKNSQKANTTLRFSHNELRVNVSLAEIKTWGSLNAFKLAH